MRLARYILRRLALLIPVLIGVSLLTFVLVRVLPGDPVLLIVPETATEADIEAARERFGLDRPLSVQYVEYLAGLVAGDFGTSITTNAPVGVQLAQRLPVTLELVAGAMVLAMAAALAGGLYAAQHAGGVADHSLRLGSLAGNALPDFWLALIFILVFYHLAGIAPAPAGRIGPEFQVPRVTGFITLDAALSGDPAALRSALAHLALPVLTLAVVITAPLLRAVRAAALEVIGSDAYRCAAAHGLSGRRLARHYLFRPTLARLPTLAAIVFGNLLGGSVIIEYVFSLQGLGQWALRGLLLRDYPVIQAFVLITATGYMIVFLLADIAQAALDPRVRV